MLRKISIKNIIKLLLSVVVAVFFFKISYQSFQWKDLWINIQNANVSFFVAGVILFFTGILFRIYKWFLILSKYNPQIRFRECVSPFLISMSLNNVLPFRIGDITRISAFNQELSVNSSRVLSSLIIERIFDFLSLVLVFIVGLIFVKDIPLPESFRYALMIALPVLLVSIFFIGNILNLIKNILLRLFKSENKLIKKILGFVVDTIDALQIIRNNQLKARLLVIALMSWLFEGGVFLATLLAIGVGFHFFAPWFSMSLATLATLLPSTPGYVGTFDYFSILGAQAFNISWNDAVVFTAITHLILWFPITVIGLLNMMFYKKFKLKVNEQTA